MNHMSSTKLNNILLKVLNKEFTFIENLSIDNGDIILTINPITLHNLFPHLALDEDYLQRNTSSPFMENIFHSYRYPVDVINLREDLESLIESLLPNHILFVLFEFTYVNNNLLTGEGS